MNILIIKKIHTRILSESTGTPKELALKLNISERTIYSRSNEIATYNSDGTALLSLEMFANFDHVSPLLDLSQLDLLCICNHVNNDASNEESRLGGNAFSKYITRRVISS